MKSHSLNPLVPEQGAGAVLSERPIADNDLPICLQPRECKLSAWNMSSVIKAENEMKVGGNGNLIKWWPLPRLPVALKGVGWMQGPRWGQRSRNRSYESKAEQEEGRSSSVSSDHSKFGRCFCLGRGSARDTKRLRCVKGLSVCSGPIFNPSFSAAFSSCSFCLCFSLFVHLTSLVGQRSSCVM